MKINKQRHEENRHKPNSLASRGGLTQVNSNLPYVLGNSLSPSSHFGSGVIVT